MLDTIQGIRTIIDRQDLPPGMRQLVAKLEESGPLNELKPGGEREVREVLQFVDGAPLLAAIVARVLESVPDTGTRLRQVARKERIENEFDKWDRVRAQVGNLALLEIDHRYYAFDEQAERIAEATGSHLAILSRHPVIALEAAKQFEWELKLIEANLDVSLITIDDDGKVNVAEILSDANRARYHQDPLDHDGDGKKGGSLAGEQSTAHTGAVKRRAKTPAA